MKIYTPSQARANLFKILEEVDNSHNPVYIVGKKSKAVLISEDDYRAMMETLCINSISGMRESILQSSKESLENFSKKIDWDQTTNVPPTKN